MDNFKIALIGYGKMGKEIHKFAKEKGIIVSEIYDIDNPIFEADTYDFNVAIDFSMPSAVIRNAEIIAKAKKNLVIGTTGWYNKKDIVQHIAEDNNIGIVWGSNFSIGMQLFFKMINYGTQLLNKLEFYDVYTHEIHHSKKKDSPSGTSLNIANIILNNIEYKKNIITGCLENEINKENLHVSSTRGGFEPGKHTVYFDSEQDIIELTHQARNRVGFAMGALKAAELIHKKKGFYAFEELLEEFWNIT